MNSEEHRQCGEEKIYSAMIFICAVIKDRRGLNLPTAPGKALGQKRLSRREPRASRLEEWNAPGQAESRLKGSENLQHGQ